MEATTKKRPRISKETHQNLEEKRDPLMSLPEPLLHRILSYLTMKDVIRTSVLSKRWRCVWLYVPCLKFSSLKMSRSKEVAFINQSLLLHKGPAIQKFSLTFVQYNEEPHHVDSWIYFAKTRNVNELNLDFRNIHNVPYVKLYGGTINDLTASTPILESISLTNCGRFANVSLRMFCGSTMKTLKIHEGDQGSSNSTMSISGAYLASFELVTSMPRKHYFIHRMKSLESASFSCNKVNCGQYKADKENIRFLILEEICHVKYLRLCSCYMQALCCKEEQSLSLSFNATYLAIKTDLTRGELPGISYMLRHSPNIETLIISIDKIQAKKCNDNLEDGEYWKLQEPKFVNMLCNLKDVKIYNFLKNLIVLASKQMITPEDCLAHLQNDMNFLRFLLKNSKVMERMTITTFKDVKFGRNSESKRLKLMFQLTQELLAFPRASQAAQISFN